MIKFFRNGIDSLVLLLILYTFSVNKNEPVDESIDIIVNLDSYMIIKYNLSTGYYIQFLEIYMSWVISNRISLDDGSVKTLLY